MTVFWAIAAYRQAASLLSSHGKETAGANESASENASGNGAEEATDAERAKESGNANANGGERKKAGKDGGLDFPQICDEEAKIGAVENARAICG